MGNPDNAGMSGLIGDEEGRCIAGFHSYIGWTTSIMVEADSLEAVHLIAGNGGPFHPCRALLEDINSLLNRSLFHTFREGKGIDAKDLFFSVVWTLSCERFIFLEAV